MTVRSYLMKINQKINDHAAQYVHPYITFAIFGLITYPLFYLIWSYSDSRGYESFELRLVATILCLILALKNFWPKKLLQFLPLYWYLTLLYCLPFLFTFLLLKNHMSYDWSMNTMTVLVLCVLLLDIVSLYVILSLGVCLGFLVYLILGNPIIVHPNYIVILITYISILLFGSLFSYRKDQLHAAEEKIKQIDAERLRIEISARESQIANQLKLTKITNQVAHDIRSPLASLLMIVKSCSAIPEMQRIALREAASSISDIANNLLTQYRAKESDITSAAETQQPVLVSAMLLQFLTEKKYEYQDRHVKFMHDVSPAGQFSFIQINLASLRRMLSNIVNNAVDAFKRDEGIVTIRLDADSNHVKVTIHDNGQGMPAEIIEKILQHNEVTSGKAEGHGIGLTQVREALRKGHGKMAIDSVIGKGTQFFLEFPRINAPTWIADDIQLQQDSIVVILDDDHSIHVAWDSRLQLILKQAPTIRVHHFESSQEMQVFIAGLTDSEKERVFLLTDFELVKQPLNGLDVVEKTNIKRAVLVTSHYANEDVQVRANMLNTKILPKQLASEIPIHIESNAEQIPQKVKSDIGTSLKQVDAIWVDDDKALTKNLELFLFDEKNVVFFNDPNLFLNHVADYPKDTRIYLDNNFKAPHNIKGLDIAVQLHELGYSRITLVSGDTFQPHDLPSYVKVLPKADIEHVMDDWK